MCVGQRGRFPTTASNRNKTTPLAAETGATPLPTGVEKQSEERERGGECPVEQTQQQHMEQEVREQRKRGKKVAELC